MKLIYSLFVLFACLDSSSQEVNWQKAFALTDQGLINAWITGTSVDLNQNIYVTGYFKGTLNLANQTITQKGCSITGIHDGYIMFVMKMDASGNLLWAKRLGVTDNTSNMTMVGDPEGNIYLVGNISGYSIDHDGWQLKPKTTSKSDVFIIKIGSDGKILWGKTSGADSIAILGGGSFGSGRERFVNRMVLS